MNRPAVAAYQYGSSDSFSNFIQEPGARYSQRSNFVFEASTHPDPSWPISDLLASLRDASICEDGVESGHKISRA